MLCFFLTLLSISFIFLSISVGVWLWITARTVLGVYMLVSWALFLKASLVKQSFLSLRWVTFYKCNGPHWHTFIFWACCNKKEAVLVVNMLPRWNVSIGAPLIMLSVFFFHSKCTRLIQTDLNELIPISCSEPKTLGISISDLIKSEFMFKLRFCQTCFLERGPGSTH